MIFKRKNKDVVPDIDFSEKGWDFQWGVKKPKRGNEIILNPDSNRRFCTYGYGELICTASGKKVIPEDTDRWIYKTTGKKKDHYENLDSY